jgi:NAD(P)-dependent dehydrogenase (short-subunit alcohol dehydrogenase family)
MSIQNKAVVVIGGSGGLGRRIVEAASQGAARVLAVARELGPLRKLAEETPGIQTLAIDATDEGASFTVFNRVKPDILVLCGGLCPPAAPLHRLSWPEFAVNWESDVKMAFHFCKAALTLPLSPGASVIVIASGAALAGSPNSGGYAGAKRTQMFIANYAQKESDRLGLGLRFTTLAPRMMPDTELGKHAVAGYARYLGISAADFIQGMDSPPSAFDVAAGVIEIVTNPDRSKGKAFIVSGKGLELVPA